jgi:hypothetical protein
MTLHPPSPTLYLAALASSPTCTQQSRSSEEMEEKENVNQNPKITEFSIQNVVCFLLGFRLKWHIGCSHYLVRCFGPELPQIMEKIL